MTKVNIRYLKSGSINIDIPREILNDKKEKLVAYCQQKLEETPDHQLREGLSDYSASSDDFFDETPEVEKIENIEDNYKSLYSSNVWDFYLDSEYSENIISENRNMAEYLKSKGLSSEEISNICYGGHKEDCQVKKFTGVSIDYNELLVETRRLLLDQYADWTPTDVGGLLFKKETIQQFLEDDFFDSEDTPSKKCLDEIKEIIEMMADSSVMYLQ